MMRSRHCVRRSIALLVLWLAWPAMTALAASGELVGPYAVNLLTSPEPIDVARLPWLPAFRHHRLYITTLKDGRQVFYRLRLGFYRSKEQALAARQSVSRVYPRAWITIVSRKEQSRSAELAIRIKAPKKAEQRRLAAASMASPEAYEEGDEDEDEEELEPGMPLTTPGPAAVAPVPAVKPRNTSGSVSSTITQAAPVPAKPEPGPPVRGPDEEPPPAIVTPTASSRTGGVATRGERLEAMLRQALTAGEYDKAIQLATALLEWPEATESQSRTGLELLGLARERNGQLAHAQAEYERYLARYPEGPDAARVRQRLAGLVTAARPPTRLGRGQSDKAAPARAEKPAPPWRTLGSFSQYYYRDERSTDSENNLVDLSQLVTTFDLSARQRGELIDQRIQITADHNYDFIDGESDYRFTRLYYEMIERDRNQNLRVGRQDHSKGGVIGRFDGLNLGTAIVEKVKMNLAGGYLLDTENLFDFTRERSFLSFNLDVGTIDEHWDFNFYTMQQMASDMIDRKAVGMEIRYFDTRFNLFTVVDYDTSYNELNTLLMNGNWLLPGNATVFYTLDVRKTPYLSTTNALQGQTAQSLDELKQTYTEAEIRQLALDRTATLRTFTIGGSHPLQALIPGRGQYQLSTDFTVTSTTGMPASGGVDAVPPTGNQFFLGLQLIGNGLFKAGDTTILSGRFGHTQTARDVQLGINTRYPITRNWRINPYVQFNRRNDRDDSDQRDVLRAALKMDYRWGRSVLLDMQLGYDSTRETLAGVSQASSALFYYLGYRWDF